VITTQVRSTVDHTVLHANTPCLSLPASILQAAPPLILVIAYLSWASYSFVDSVRMTGWVDLDGWLHTEMVYPPDTVIHPRNNRARLRATTMFENSALALSHAVQVGLHSFFKLADVHFTLILSQWWEMARAILGVARVNKSVLIYLMPTAVVNRNINLYGRFWDMTSALTLSAFLWRQTYRRSTSSGSMMPYKARD